ncbi:MAG: caspase family protein [Bacteroidetes bacterium]|nr:caspase family protein [Bacteroidota bacterium]
MKKINIYHLCIFLLVLLEIIPKLSYCGAARIGLGPFPPHLYIISIGINKYPGHSFAYSVSDSRLLTEKFQKDYLNYMYESLRKGEFQAYNDLLTLKTDTLPFAGQIAVAKFYNLLDFRLLNDSSATISNIKKAFDEISLKAGPEDYFIFYFAGISVQLGENHETFLIPYMNDLKPEISGSYIDWFPIANTLLSVKLLSKWMDQIQCKKQVLISEAGNGEEFSTNLAVNLFEKNPILQSSGIRNRIIITTNGYGREGEPCEGTESGGALTNLLCHSSNILQFFDDPKAYEFEITKKDIQCNIGHLQNIYSKFIFEEDFRKLQQKLASGNSMRGNKLIGDEHNNDKTTTVSHKPKNYALLIATNDYNNNPDWQDLKNPVNDAKAISEILKQQFGYETKTVINQNRDSIYTSIIKYKNTLMAEDNLLIFIAGHGYYAKDFGAGNIVARDSKTIAEDPYLDTYIPLAKLNVLLDIIPSKHIFLVLDICFGGSFDLVSPDLALEKYDLTKADVPIDTIIARKKDKYCRIFLASGTGNVPDYWSNSLDHSPFAQKIIRTLKENNIFFTPGILYSSLEGNITEPKFKSFGRHEAHGDFFIIRVKQDLHQ